MTKAYRVTQDQQNRAYAEAATTSSANALALEELLEESKPRSAHPGWHRLIATPFRYPLPVPLGYAARFHPPGFNKNVLYCSEQRVTALYEFAYHFMRQRVHLSLKGNDTGWRTSFSVTLLPGHTTDITKAPRIEKIMDRRDYAESHAYILQHHETKVLRYPSCRDPQKRSNFAVFDIACMGKNVSDEIGLDYCYRPASQAVSIWSQDESIDITVAFSKVD